MRKKYLLMVIAGALVLATMIGGTLAALNVKSEEAATADISIKSVGVTIYDEQTPLGTLPEEKPTEIVPGTDVAMARKVVNSVDDGYDVYVKVVIYKNWEVDGEQLYPETGVADLLYVESGEKGRQDLAAAGTNEKVNGWIVQYADDEQIVAARQKKAQVGRDDREQIDDAEETRRVAQRSPHADEPQRVLDGEEQRKAPF